VATDSTAEWHGNSDSVPKVPDFDLLRPIGEGSFGKVWLATNRTTGQLRAVKLILLNPSDRVDRAGREIVSLVRLEANVRNQHPNLLGIQHVGQTAQHLFYVMNPADDITGGPASLADSYRPATLKERLERGPLSQDDCLLLSRQLLAGLACIHKAGMVHRDVKPANCLFIDGELKLGDFGLLTMTSAEPSLLGTRKYMPPDGHMDARADVFAAGLIIYEMLTGLPVEAFPHLGQRAREIADSSALRILNRLVLRACQGDPKQRFPNAIEMLDALMEAKAGRPRIPVPVRTLVLIAVVVSLGVLTVPAAISLWHVQPDTVDVSFITEPFGAAIYLDGRPLLQPDGKPYRTPCTVPGLPGQTHHLSFKREGNGDLNVGEIDLETVREVTARWSDAPK
jgi:serine/threonine protein kinase